MKTIDIQGVEIFAVGTHHGVEYTEDDLQQIVNDTNAQEGREPYVFLGHRDGADRGAKPRSGMLANLRYEAGKVIADILRIPADVMDAVKAGGYPKRSVEMIKNFRDKTGKVYPLIIDALALIGAGHPEVKDLADVYATEEPQLITVFTEGGWPSVEGDRMSDEKVTPDTNESPPEVTPKAEEKEVVMSEETAVEESVEDETAVKKIEMEETLESQRIELSEAASRHEEDKAENAKLQKTIDGMNVDKVVTGFVTAGKVTPAEAVGLRVEMGALLNVRDKLKFGDEEMTLYDRRIKELEAREVLVNFGEEAETGEGPDGEDTVDSDTQRGRGMSADEEADVHDKAKKAGIEY